MPKRKADKTDTVTKKRKSITLQTKYDIINEQEAGTSITALASKYSMGKSTICTIIKDKQKFIKEVTKACPLQSTRVRNKDVLSLIPRLENLLSAWIADQTQRLNIPMTQRVICAKALSLFKTLKDKYEGECEETFVASNGWFYRYKNRVGWHNIKIQGEAASADHEAAKLFPKELEEIIETYHYMPSQIFNVDETGLFWKRMPGRSYIAKEESSMPGFKVAKDRLTLLLGGNASGDCKLKPMLVHRAENPRALKGLVKATLPVIWKANKKAWVTASLFEDWFSNHFVPEVKKYCEDKDIPFHVLLLVDNAPGHPSSLQHNHPNVRFIFLPPNTTSLLQPMDQGVIATFKAYYLRTTFEKLINAIDTEGGPTLKDFWKSFNVLDAVKIIKGAWDKVSETNMKGVWHKLCPQLKEDFEGFDEPVDIVRNETEKIVEIANKLQLDVLTDDITDLLNEHDRELTNEDLIEMEDHQEPVQEEENNPVETPVYLFTLKRLEEAFASVKNACDIFESQDSNFERSGKVAADLNKAIVCYREIYNEKKKTSFRQKTLDEFFIKKKDAIPTPSTSKEPNANEKEASIDESETAMSSI